MCGRPPPLHPLARWSMVKMRHLSSQGLWGTGRGSGAHWPRRGPPSGDCKSCEPHPPASHASFGFFWIVFVSYYASSAAAKATSQSCVCICAHDIARCTSRSLVGIVIVCACYRRACVCVCVRLLAYVRECACVQERASVCMYVCVCLCACV